MLYRAVSTVNFTQPIITLEESFNEKIFDHLTSGHVIERLFKVLNNNKSHCGQQIHYCWESRKA